MNLSAVIRAPVSRRAWAETLYLLVSLPLTVAGAAYAVFSLIFCAALAITAVGIPLLALALQGARLFGTAHRRLAGALLNERVAAPEPLRPSPGLYGWVQSGLSDGTGWRALGYLLIKLPLGLVGLYLVAFTWGYGVVGLGYPVLHALRLNDMTSRDASGAVRHGLTIGGFVFDSWPRTLLVSATGLVLLLLAPWAVRGMVIFERLLVRTLLGPQPLAERVQDLEKTRAQAVDDAAATLRRIERDLHDGAQARLIALAMNLTMVKAALPPDSAARTMIADAHTHAREALAELRELVRGIHPPVLDKGLDVALATLAARSALPVSLHTDLRKRPAPALETIAYFCAAELLANAAKHSGASAVSLLVTQPPGLLRLRVGDDGTGGAAASGGTGLTGLRDRIGPVDGRLDIDSPAGGPTVITVDLPDRS